MLHLSLHCSTSSPSCSSFSCSFVHARTSARSRRGSLTVTSKGTCPPLYVPMPSPPFPSTECPYRFRQFSSNSCAHPLIVFPVCQLLPLPDSWVFFSCPHESVSLIPHTQTSLLSDQPKPVFAPCAGERLSPYVALACIAMAVRMILS